MVTFVGAGPGDPELITIKGMKKIQSADVIIYAGSLVNEEILKYSKNGCAIYDSAFMCLEEVIFVMKQSEKENKNIVRIHTGDPSLYGAIQEQIDILKIEGIPFELIPGVSSFCGAGAALQQEYTLPGVTQTVIITRIEGRTPVPKKESIKSLGAHGATMVLFLSVGKIEEVVEELKYTYEYNTPAAVVYKATWKDEKIIRGTLNDISQKVKKENINKTALIVISPCMQTKYELSKLYDKHFTTEFREGI